MARPESIKDVKEADRFVRIAMFEIDKIVTNSVLLKHYTSLIQAVEHRGGMVQKNYNTVDVSVPKSTQELEQQLEYDQRGWDESQKYYNLALNRGPADADIPEWRRNSIISWAKENDLPDPFDVFAANNEDIQALRDEMGLDNE